MALVARQVDQIASVFEVPVDEVSEVRDRHTFELGPAVRLIVLAPRPITHDGGKPGPKPVEPVPRIGDSFEVLAILFFRHANRWLIRTPLLNRSYVMHGRSDRANTPVVGIPVERNSRSGSGDSGTKYRQSRKMVANRGSRDRHPRVEESLPRRRYHPLLRRHRDLARPAIVQVDQLSRLSTAIAQEAAIRKLPLVSRAMTTNPGARGASTCRCFRRLWMRYGQRTFRRSGTFRAYRWVSPGQPT